MWLTQAQLAELYSSSVQNVGYHIGNIFEDEELQADSVIKESFITASDGKSYRAKLYNLEMLLSLGYRIKSKVATKFRQWATKHLKELMTKGRTELQPMSDAEIMSRALEIAHRTLEAREERIKALTAERDEAIRTKTNGVSFQMIPPSGKQEMLIVSEPGLYSLVSSSKKPEAKAFKWWVNHEVLPSIRKNFFRIYFRGSDLDVRPTNVVWTKKRRWTRHPIASSGHSEWF